MHCFFEQSGTFKREFIKLGIPAEDYDIQNNFGETDHTDDLFAEIEKAYAGGVSLFDSITKDDLIMAFFPCIKFCSVMERIQHEDFYDASQRKRKDFGTKDYYVQKWAVLRNYSQERFYFYDLALKLTAICQINGFRMIMENPWHPVNFTNHFWFMRTSLIDNDRTRRGDYFRKPTAYWFTNCEPTHGETLQPIPRDQVRTITSGSVASRTAKKMKAFLDKDELNHKYLGHASAKGLCDEERSMISPDYARNFICDFILGKKQEIGQLTIFDPPQ